MWYGGCQAYEVGPWRVGYATSPDGITWTKYEGNPVLDLGANGEWDDVHVGYPSVILDGGTYRMWYRGYDGTYGRFGCATSPDGINWTKWTSNPILVPGPTGNWDDSTVDEPSVLLDGNIYKMWYSGSSGDLKIGTATSPVSISADSNGNPKDSFNPGETVYAAANWTLLSEGSYTLYIVDNTTWTDQMTIPGRKSGTAETISVNSSGNIPTQAIWSDPPETESYDIVIDVDSDGKFDFNYDFVDYVTVTAGFTLPVELSAFIAASVNGYVMLTWRTESEVNNVGFAIYRSDAKDGKYAKIGWLDGAGNSAMPHEYQFLDKQVEIGKTYFYYIEDVDIVGERDSSDIIQITVTPRPRPQAVIPAKFEKVAMKQEKLLGAGGE